jgi:hypothetical protein
MAQAQEAMDTFGLSDEGDGGGGGAAELAKMINDPVAMHQVLEIPAGVPFDQPESREFKWDQALTAEDLLGLLGTFSWVILMDDETRSGVFEMARTLLAQGGIEGDATIDVGYSAAGWKARRHT